MARFIVHTEEKKKRRTRMFIFFSLISTITCFLYCLFFDGRAGFMRYAVLLFVLNGSWIVVWIVMDSLQKMGKLRFVEVTEQYVEWLIYDKNYPAVFIDWKDIRWIKKENDGSVSVFQDSSISNNLSVTELMEEDRNEILYLLVQYAGKRGIKLVNFSEPVLVPA